MTGEMTQQPAAESERTGTAVRDTRPTLFTSKGQGSARQTTPRVFPAQRSEARHEESEKYASQKNESRELKSRISFLRRSDLWWWKRAPPPTPPQLTDCLFLLRRVGRRPWWSVFTWCPLSHMSITQPTCCFQCQNSAGTNVKRAKLATFKGM